jgi:aerobic-type carbon monoxide dehydrogenase small subunit (CoxS/CutS family)
MHITMQVNGHPACAEVAARALPENLRLTGTHVGCDTAQCGITVMAKRAAEAAVGAR